MNDLKILMVNKFLYPAGGAETYMFKLGKHLEALGNEIQYFGMDSESRCVSNMLDCYTDKINFVCRDGRLDNVIKRTHFTIF